MKTRAKCTPRKPAAAPAAKAAARRPAADAKRPTPRRRTGAGEAAPEEIGGRAGAATAAAYNAAADGGQERLSRVSMGLLQGRGDAAGRESADVLMRATGTMARAAEDLGKAWFDLAQLSFQNGATLARGVAEARSLHDLVELQADMACRSVDLALLEGQRLSELSRTVAIEALLPLQAQLASVFATGFRRPD